MVTLSGLCARLACMVASVPRPRRQPLEPCVESGECCDRKQTTRVGSHPQHPQSTLPTSWK